MGLARYARELADAAASPGAQERAKALGSAGEPALRLLRGSSLKDALGEVPMLDSVLLELQAVERAAQPADAPAACGMALLRMLELCEGNARDDGVSWGLEALRAATLASLKKWLLWAAQNAKDSVDVSLSRFYSKSGKGQLTLKPAGARLDAEWDERMKRARQTAEARLAARFARAWKVRHGCEPGGPEHCVRLIVRIFETSIRLLEDADLSTCSPEERALLRSPPAVRVGLIEQCLAKKDLASEDLKLSLDDLKSFARQHIQQCAKAKSLRTAPAQTSLDALGGRPCGICGFMFTTEVDCSFRSSDESHAFTLACPRCRGGR